MSSAQLTRLIPVRATASEAIDVPVKVLAVENPSPNAFPELIVVRSADLVAELFEELGSEIVYRDVEDIIAHVVMTVIMHGDDPGDIEHLNMLPNFNLMRSTAFFKDNQKIQNAMQASLRFAVKLARRLTALGVLPAGDGRYMFKNLLHHDVVLEKVQIPY